MNLTDPPEHSQKEGGTSTFTAVPFAIKNKLSIYRAPSSMNDDAPVQWRRVQLEERRGGALHEYGNGSRMYGSAQKAKCRTEHTVQYTLVRKGRGKNVCSWLLVLA